MMFRFAGFIGANVPLTANALQTKLLPNAMRSAKISALARGD
jgi:hypothetical protein